MNRLLCVLLITALTASCNKEPDAPQPASGAGYKEYIIARGGHYANYNPYKEIHINKLKFSALFDSSCIYSNIKEWNNGDVNKLYGFSDCNTQHHENSARFGWRWTGSAIALYAYCYVNKERIIKPLGTVPVCKAIEMSIAVNGAQYVFELNGKVEVLPRNCEGEYAHGYQLYPYFGGDEVAPQDIRILIKDLE